MLPQQVKGERRSEHLLHRAEELLQGDDGGSGGGGGEADDHLEEVVQQVPDPVTVAPARKVLFRCVGPQGLQAQHNRVAKNAGNAKKR